MTTQLRSISSNVDMRNISALAAGIILQAIEDWISLIRLEWIRSTKGDDAADRYQWARLGNANYTEILRFFETGLGAALCDTLNIEASEVIRKLLKMRSDYRSYGTLPKMSGLSGDEFNR